MSAKVIPPLYISTPDDSLVVVDVYAGGETPLTPVNVLQPLVSEAEGALSKVLGGMNGDVAGILGKAVELITSGQDLKTKDFAKAMLGEVFPNAQAALNDLKGGLMDVVSNTLGIDADSVLSAYRSVKDADFNDIMGTLASSNPLAKLYIDGHEIVKRAEDIDSLGDLFNVAGDIFGNSQIGKALNLGAEFQALKSLVDTAVALGAPELADYLIGNVDDIHQQALVRSAAQSSALAGDVTALYGYMYVMNVAEALNEDPEMPEKFLSNFVHPTESGPTAESMNMVLSILDGLKPDWDGSITGRPDISIWQNLSPAMKELIYLDGRYAYLVAAADGIEDEPLAEVAKRTMDWIVIDEGNAQNLI